MRGVLLSRRGPDKRATAAVSGADVTYSQGDAQPSGAQSAATTVTHLFVVAANPQAYRSLVGSTADGGMNIFATNDGRLQAYTAGSNGVYVSQSEPFLTSGKVAACGMEYDASTGMIAWYGNGHVVSTDQRPGGFTLSGSGTVTVGPDVLALERYPRCMLGPEVRSVTARQAARFSAPLDRVGGTTTTPLTPRQLSGSNIMPTNDQLHASPGPWAGMWRDWNWAWMSGCVDRAAQHGAGVVRAIGDVSQVQSGAVTQATYLNRLAQLADYVGSKGMLLYYTGCDLAQRGNAGQADVVNQYKAAAQVLEARYQSVFGFDMCNEIASVYGNSTAPLDPDVAFTWLTAASQAIHQAAPHVPVSVSDLGGGGGSGALGRAGRYDLFKKWAGVLDFFDIHAYDENPYGGLQPWHTAPFEASVDRALVIGEFGVNFSDKGDASAAQSYSRSKALKDSSTQLAAALQWAIRNDDWGLHTEGTDAQRTQTVAVFESMSSSGTTPPPATTNHLLMETGDALLLEDSTVFTKETT